MAHPVSRRLPQSEAIVLPVTPDAIDGPSVKGSAEIVARKGDRGVGCLTFSEKKLSWIDDYEHFEFAIRSDGVVIAVRKATPEDIKRWRVPIWIQGDEVPMCCGEEMVFVGQIDDDRLCAEAPTGAKMWWHDAASFYVFTCPRCLEVTAVGQQC